MEPCSPGPPWACAARFKEAAELPTRTLATRTWSLPKVKEVSSLPSRHHLSMDELRVVGQTAALRRRICGSECRTWVENVSSRTPAAVIRLSPTRVCVGMRLECREAAPDRSLSAAMFGPQISRQTWRGCVIRVARAAPPDDGRPAPMQQQQPVTPARGGDRSTCIADLTAQTCRRPNERLCQT